MNKSTVIMSMVKMNTLEEPTIDKAIDDNLDIVSTVINEAISDTENESSNLLKFYKECSEVDRGVIDTVLVYLCGWTMESLIDKAEPMIY